MIVSDLVENPENIISLEGKYRLCGHPINVFNCYIEFSDFLELYLFTKPDAIGYKQRRENIICLLLTISRTSDSSQENLSSGFAAKIHTNRTT